MPNNSCTGQFVSFCSAQGKRSGACEGCPQLVEKEKIYFFTLRLTSADMSLYLHDDAIQSAVNCFAAHIPGKSDTNSKDGQMTFDALRCKGPKSPSRFKRNMYV